MRLFLSAGPAMVGGPPVIKQDYPKTGGVIVFYDSLNAPTATFSGGLGMRWIS
jgi:hypothetical protein